MFRIPIGLTALQRDLVEVLVQAHKTQLLERQVDELLLRNIHLLTNHPFLLVDHYMPKQLLQMETHEKLLEASDLFHKLDKLLCRLQRTRYRVLLVGSSIKELDLVEAFINGRDLSYKRYSGMSLYEPQETTATFTLYLVTKQQLIPQVDFVITLDNSLQLQWQCPVISFLSVQSPMHGMLTHDKETSLLSSLVTRSNDYTRVYEPFGTLFEALEQLDFHSWPQCIPEFQVYSPSEAIYSLHTQQEKKIKADDQDYPKLITGLTLQRVEEIYDEMDKNAGKLKPLRLRGTLYHNQWDQEKLNIGELFKESLKLKEEATAQEGRVTRLEAEGAKYQEKMDGLGTELAYLTKVEKGEEILDDEGLDEEITQLEAQLQGLLDSNRTSDSAMDELRMTYQRITSTAAEKSLLSLSLKNQNDDLVKRLSDTAFKLRTASVVKQQQRVEMECQRARVTLTFLEKYNGALSAQVKERMGTLTVGRNGRVHRSTTPYV